MNRHIEISNEVYKDGESMGTTKNQIIELLSQTDDYVSGAILSQQFGMSRSAIWKHMNQLKESGYHIESVKHKGYRLLEFPESFSTQEVWSSIKAYGLVQEVVTIKSVDSTNEEAKRMANTGNGHNILILAEEQLAGKGRRGRTWVSEKGAGIYMSFLLHPSFQPIHASKLTLLAGLAVYRGILSVTGLKVAIKWPNDLVYNGKKIGGILTEMSTEMNEIRYVIVGIGINVNGKKMAVDIQSMATSLGLILEKKVNKKLLLSQIVEVFSQLYNAFSLSNSLAFMIEAYNQQCITVGKEIQIISKNESEIGHCIEVGLDGGLKVVIDGEERIIQSGEVSVRGLYGYVD